MMRPGKRNLPLSSPRRPDHCWRVIEPLALFSDSVLGIGECGTEA